MYADLYYLIDIEDEIAESIEFSLAEIYESSSFKEHVYWCANECGYIEKGIIPKFFVCSDGINWFKERNEWHDRGESYYPIIGDIIFFDWKDENGNQDGTSDHVGIVTRTDY